MAEAKKRGGHKRPAHLAGGSVEQKVWDAVRELHALGKPFTRADVEFVSKQADRGVRCYVCRLVAGGFLKGVAKLPKSATCPHFTWQKYRLARDVGQRAPRLDREGKLLRETNRERMWTALRILKHLSPLDLQLSVNAAGGNTLPYNAAKTYLQRLAIAGYLVVVSVGRGGPDGGRPSTYRLINAMDTGPRSPIQQGCGAFFDPNLREVTWQPK